MTTVYFSDHEIQVISGTHGAAAKIDTVTPSVFIGDCTFNGLFTQKEEIINRINTLFDENGLRKKSVALVVSSSRIITRVMNVPAGTDESMTAYIANEFSDIERAREQVVAYSVVSRDRKTGLVSVIATLAAKELINSYVELFGKCEITLESVEPSLFCTVRSLRGSSAAGKTCIVQIRERSGVTSVMLENGAYTYTGFTRVDSESSAAATAAEMLGAVNQILLFAQAQRIDSKIEEVYFAGFSDEETAEATARLASSGLGVTAGAALTNEKVTFSEELAAAGSVGFGDVLIPVGSMMKREKCANLFARMNRDLTAPTKPKKLSVGLLAAALIIIAAVCFSVLAVLQRRQKQAEYDSLLATINAPGNVEKNEEYEALLDEKNELSARKEAIQSLTEFLATYPSANSEILAELYDCAGKSGVSIQVTGYSSITGELRLAAVAESAEKVSGFISELTQNDHFTNSSYSGFYEIDDSDMRGVNVSVKLSADAGKAEAK